MRKEAMGLDVAEETAWRTKKSSREALSACLSRYLSKPNRTRKCLSATE